MTNWAVDEAFVRWRKDGGKYSRSPTPAKLTTLSPGMKRPSRK
jgi:hypothetical protein